MAATATEAKETSEPPLPAAGTEQKQVDLLLDDFNKHVDQGVSVPIAAYHALYGVIRRTKAKSVMALKVEIKEASDQLKAEHKNDSVGCVISLKAGCDMFLVQLTRVILSHHDDGFATCLEALLAGADQLADANEIQQKTICKYGADFIQDNSVVLVHGYCPVVIRILAQAAKDKLIDVITTECRPTAEGYKVAKALIALDIPVTVVVDSATNFVMGRVDMVLVGAQGVAESGGIISQIGTSMIALTAHAHRKPFYVAAESCKFARLFPLNQSDLPACAAADPAVDLTMGTGPALPKGAKAENPLGDYTSPGHITLLLTDIGVLTPSAVSDELIKLYQ